MLYDSHRQLAQPGERSTCPACGQVLIAKCGEIVIWHWAHQANDCDPWAEPESEWHLEWKRRLELGGATVEVAMGEHRADVVLPDGRIVELQARYQNVETIEKREAFYGNQLAWMYRCDWHEYIHWGKYGFWWKHGAKSMTHHRRPIFWEMGVDIAHVMLNLEEKWDGTQRVLGKFGDRRSHEEMIAKWVHTDAYQMDLQGKAAPIIAPDYADRSIESVVDSVIYRFPGAEII